MFINLIALVVGKGVGYLPYRYRRSFCIWWYTRTNDQDGLELWRHIDQMRRYRIALHRSLTNMNNRR